MSSPSSAGMEDSAPCGLERGVPVCVVGCSRAGTGALFAEQGAVCSLQKRGPRAGAVARAGGVLPPDREQSPLLLAGRGLPGPPSWPRFLPGDWERRGTAITENG